jgi:tetratricopeptide (TPR) repeat protein
MRPEHIWDERYFVAAARHDEGDYDKAQAHYAQLLKHAHTPNHTRLIQYRQALLAQDTGHNDQALKQYKALYDAPLIDEHGAHAMSNASELMPQLNQRLALKRRLAQRYPQTISAEHAIESLKYDAIDHQTLDEFLVWLRQLQTKIKGTDLEDHALFTQAYILEKHLVRPNAALPLYKAVYALAPNGSLADDAVWRIAKTYEALGEWKQALVWLARVSKDNEESWFIGTYASEFADNARLRMGFIYKDELKNYPQAIEQFERFLSEFPNSRWADDAAWHRVEAKQLAGASDYEQARTHFIKSYPKSRFVRQARATRKTSQETP